MQILSNLLYINDTDVYTTFGAFLTETSAGEFTNYEALLRPAEVKETVAVDYPDRHGEQQPDVPDGLRLKGRDFTLYFALVADTAAEYFRRYAAFFSFLRTGDRGWLTLRLPEFDRTFRVRYTGAADAEQLTPLSTGQVGSRFRLNFREPLPLY